MTVRRNTHEHIDQITRMKIANVYRTGLETPLIYERFGIVPHTLYRILEEFNIPKRTASRRPSPP